MKSNDTVQFTAK
uniref:Uncharacterized protein n=1 Tax=Anguilla anguilla TaxID=7936 RepID=A0A0E9PGI5_ANGAN